MTIKNTLPNETHQAFRQDALALLKKYAGELTEMEMLALGSHLVGQLLAMQNQRTMTGAQGIALIQANIEQGNAEAVRGLMASQGRA